MIRRLAIWLRIGRLLPRCGALPPWLLADAEPCIIPRGHESTGREDADWHADGNGFIWNDVLGRWRWMGPMVDLAEEYRDRPDREETIFEEFDPTHRCDQEQLIVICDDAGDPDREVCPDCGREFPR